MSCTYQHFNITRKNLKKDFSYIEILISLPTCIIMFYKKTVQRLGGIIYYANQGLKNQIYKSCCNFTENMNQ